MEIPRSRLGLQGEDIVTVVNLKCDPLLSGSLRAEPGFFPAYHMNKEHWISVLISVLLDVVGEDKLLFLIDMSWELIS